MPKTAGLILHFNIHSCVKEKDSYWKNMINDQKYKIYNFRFNLMIWNVIFEYNFNYINN